MGRLPNLDHKYLTKVEVTVTNTLAYYSNQLMVIKKGIHLGRLPNVDHKYLTKVEVTVTNTLAYYNK